MLWRVPEFSLIAEWLPVTVPVLVMLIAAAGFAGWIDAVVGGGGLIQLPALVIGVPNDVPTPYVLGTNKISSFAGTLSASWVYLRRIKVQLALLAPLVAGAFLGSAIGANVSRFLPREWLTPTVLVAVVAVGAYVYSKPQLGLHHRPSHGRVAAGARAAVIGVTVGLYDGLLGPGTGSFFMILIVVVLGYGFLEASVNAKIANITTNVAAILVYGIHGELLWVLGACMAAANVTGGIIGAQMAVSQGNAFIRRVFLVVLGILVVKLGYDTVVAFL